MVYRPLRPDSLPSEVSNRPEVVRSKRIRRHGTRAVVGLALLVVLGCQPDEEIRRYEVPKEGKAEQAPAVLGRVRLLAAILPQGNNSWFFKLVGPTPDVTTAEATFHQFIQSIRFPAADDDRIIWTVPEGWKEEGPKEFRYRTFHLGTKDKPLELTVFKFAGRAGSTLDNVNRWRGRDLGLEDIGLIELSHYTKTIQVGDVKATLVDMTGPGAPKTGM